MDNENRRFEYRTTANIIVRNMELAQGKPDQLQGIIRELSASGCHLETSSELSVGQELLLTFELDENLKIEKQRALVVRQIDYAKPPSVVIEFIDLPEPEQYKIREFIVWKEAQEGSA